MNGLTENQAKKALTKYGLNLIKEKPKTSPFIVFLSQFNNFLSLLLLAAAGISLFIGEYVDGSLIFIIVFLNALFGVYQEEKAEASVKALRKMTVTKVRVIRGGQEKEIDSRYLVPGDLIFIEEGSRIPVDGQILTTKNLEVDESALTGESLLVRKKNGNKIFMGTIVTRGHAYIKAEKTGMKTKFGQIALELDKVERKKSPLEKKLTKASKIIGLIGIIIAIAVFLLSIFDGNSLFSSFLLATALAVAVVPEGLPAVMTTTLSIGVREMAKRKAILRKLSSIEALGSITLIATDKTGTLTTNQMTLNRLYINQKELVAKDLKELPPPSFDDPLALTLLIGILCSTASLVKIDHAKKWDILGDPTEGALLIFAKERGIDPEEVKKKWPLVEEGSFDSQTKRMSVAIRRGNHLVHLIKGAPESVLATTDKVFWQGKESVLTNKIKEKFQRIFDRWTNKGYRPLAFAYNNVFLGIIALNDPPRPEVKVAVEKARQAGIKTVMITGDNANTALWIAQTTGIIAPHSQGEILTGIQVDQYTDKELLKKLPQVKIFARTNPFHKHRIVKLYQQLGHTVAVTGDGVNDAIALKQADIGVAMGLVGTDVARETADMVIADDNFATIINAVEEGRNITKNIKNSIVYLLACNVSEALSLTIGLLLGFPNIFIAIQFLYINLVTDGLPALAMAFSPKDRKIMARPPQKDSSLLGHKELKYIFLVGLTATALVIGSFFLFLNRSALPIAKTTAFTILTLIQSFIFIDVWLNHRSLTKSLSLMKRPIFIGAAFFPFFLQLAIVSSSQATAVFKIAPASSASFLIYILIAATILPIIRIFH